MQVAVITEQSEQSAGANNLLMGSTILLKCVFII